MLKDKEEQEAGHQQMQCKLEDTEEKMEALQVMIDKAHKENSDLLKEKEQLEETQRETQHILQEFETQNTELQIFYNEVKEIKLNLRKYAEI